MKTPGTARARAARWRRDKRGAACTHVTLAFALGLGHVADGRSVAVTVGPCARSHAVRAASLALASALARLTYPAPPRTVRGRPTLGPATPPCRSERGERGEAFVGMFISKCCAFGQMLRLGEGGSHGACALKPPCVAGATPGRHAVLPDATHFHSHSGLNSCRSSRSCRAS